MQKHTIVDFSDKASTFFNINNDADLKNAEQHFIEYMR